MANRRPISAAQAAALAATVLLALVLSLGFWPTRDGAASDEESSSSDKPSMLLPMAAAAETNTQKIGGSLWRRRYAELVEPGP